MGTSERNPGGNPVMAEITSRNTPGRFMLQDPGWVPAWWGPWLICRLYLYLVESEVSSASKEGKKENKQTMVSCRCFASTTTKHRALEQKCEHKSELLYQLGSIFNLGLFQRNQSNPRWIKSGLISCFWGWTSSWARMEWRKERNKSHSITTEKQALVCMPQVFARNFKTKWKQ